MKKENAFIKSAKRDPRIRKLLEGLIDQINSGQFMDIIADFVKFKAMFHQYSPLNMLLITVNKPDVTIVAGYRKWETLGRHVREGEKGIPIFAPIFSNIYLDVVAVSYFEEGKQVPDLDLIDKIPNYLSDTMVNYRIKKLQEKGIEKYGEKFAGVIKIDEELIKILKGYRIVHVFDISQTDICTKRQRCYKKKPFTVEDIPAYRYSVTNLEDRELFNTAYLVADKVVRSVRIEEFLNTWKVSGHKGMYYPDEDMIVINAALSTFDRAETLIHETAHALIRKKYHEDMPIEIEEVIVETVAYIMLKVWADHESAVAKRYITMWLHNAQANADIILQYMGTVSNIVSDMLTLAKL